MSNIKKIRAVISWSSGKDSTLTLLRLLADPNVEVVGLLTTYVGDSIPFQATSLSMVKAQAKAVNLPLILVELPKVFPANEVYQSLVINAIKKSDLNIEAVAFGDMFCNGIAEYRQSYIEPAGLKCLFPLLGESSISLATEIIDAGIKTLISTVDTTQLDKKFLGKQYNQKLIRSLPQSVDPCGEDGEFHTLVYDAPCFTSPLNVEIEKHQDDGRFYSVVMKLKAN